MSFGIDLAPGLMTARHGLVKLKPPPQVVNSTLMVVMQDGCNTALSRKWREVGGVMSPVAHVQQLGIIPFG